MTIYLYICIFFKNKHKEKLKSDESYPNSVAFYSSTSSTLMQGLHISNNKQKPY